MSHAIVVTDLHKSYGDTAALKGVSFQVERGKVTSILGPNGAGKTTCIRILSTTLMPTKGSVQVFERDVITQAHWIRSQIAVVPQNASPDNMLTAWEQVYGYLLARGIPSRVAAQRTEYYLRRLSLWDVRNRTTDTYSGGMRRRTMIAAALAAETPLLVLDEPTTGLDPEAKREVWELLHELQGNTTLILTTHLMDEVEALADWVIVFARGELVAQGTVAELRAAAPGAEKLLIPRCIPREQLALLGHVQEDGNRWALFPADSAALHEAIDLVRLSGEVVSVERSSLEDGYLALVQKGSARRSDASEGGL